MGHRELMRATVAPKEGAELLGSNRKAVTAWIKRGESPFFTVELSPRRRLYRAYPADLERVRSELPRCPVCGAIALSGSGACQAHVARVTQTGTVRSPASRARMRDAKLGTTRPPETRAKISETLREQRERTGRLVACPSCGKTRYRSPSGVESVWCKDCWPDSPQGRASLQRARTAKQAVRRAERDDLRSKGLLTMADLAEELRVSRPTLTAHYIASGQLPAEWSASQVGPPILVVRGMDKRRFLREWALSVRKGDSKRLHRLDPEWVVGWYDKRGHLQDISRGRGLTTEEAAAIVRQRVEARRRAIRRHGRGPEKDAHFRERILDTVAEVLEDTPPDQLTDLKLRPLLLQVVLYDWANHRQDWSRYRGPDDFELDPQLYAAAVDRLRKLPMDDPGAGGRTLGAEARALLDYTKSLQMSGKRIAPD